MVTVTSYDVRKTGPLYEEAAAGVEPFTRQQAIVCRETFCYLTKALGREGWSHVTKVSWTSNKQKPEACLFGLVRWEELRVLPR
jgi:hypothetical protein